MDRPSLRIIGFAIAALSLACHAGCGGDAQGGKRASNDPSAEPIDTPEKNVMCPPVDGGVVCPDGGDDAGDAADQ